MCVMSLIGFNSNTTSLQAQRQLGQSSSVLSKSFERLASGQRINQASDDAAGLAIADTLRTGSRLYATAIRNINDGVSVISIMDSAVAQQTSLVSRLAELAEQSGNGTFSETQRGSLNTEYQQLLSEFGRLADSTSFNGVNLLRARRSDGVSAISIQAGISGASTSRITIAGVDTTRFSGVVDLSRLYGDFDDGSRNGVRDGEVDAADFIYFFDAIDGGISKDRLFQMFGNQVTTTKVIDSQGNERELLVSFSSSDGAGADGANPLALTVWSKDSATGLYKGYSWQGTQSYATGTGAVFSVDASGTITSGAVQSGQVDFGSGVTANLQMDLSGLSFINSSSGTQASALDLTGVETASRALNALDVAKARLIELAAIRGLLGAAEKRLQVAAEINRVSAENFTAAESRIRDVDVAEESSVLIRQGILQQVGASVIAQANQAPRLALQLLQS